MASDIGKSESPNAVEKARQSIVGRYGTDADLETELSELEAAIRADEREQCAKLVEDAAIPENFKQTCIYTDAERAVDEALKLISGAIRSREHAKGEGNVAKS